MNTDLDSGTDLVPLEGDDDDLVIYEGDEAEVVETTEDISEQIAAAAAAMSRLAREASEIVIEQEQTGTALVPSNVSAGTAKKQLAHLRANAARQQMLIESKQSEIRERHKEIEQLMRRQQAIAEQQLKPLMKYIERLSEGIWMVNLYLGRDEEIVMLKDGEPAPADEPIIIRQMVLAMDEECAINPDDDGIDSTNIEEFDEWLKASQAHIDQVIPEKKSVVALRPRFHSKQYENPWMQEAIAKADKQTYFLIRNGDKLYRTWTEFNVGPRLVSTTDEFSSYFYEERRSHVRGEKPIRVSITPGTPAWERAEEAADAQKRHYMRVGLVLQGLVDRTTVFHPLPEGGVSFMDYEQGGKTWKFLSNDEMTLTTGRKPFYDWLREKNAELKVGMRIVGSFTRNYSQRDDEWTSRIWPRGAERPPSGELLAIEEKQHNGWIVRYKRTEQVYDAKAWVPSGDRPGWGHYGRYRAPKTRASCVIGADDTNFLPFDLVTEEEMTEYLSARLDRHAYADMFPLLKKAILAKRAEREQEQPFRVMLSGVLARDNNVSVSDAEASLDELIDWFKLINKSHRPLVGSEKDQAKAVRMIVSEHARRLKAERQGASTDAVNAILRQFPSAILVGRKRTGRYVALVPENDEDVFVNEIEFSSLGNGLSNKRWQLIKKARVARWLVLHTTERYDGWLRDAPLSQHITGPEFDRMVEQIVAEAEKLVAAAYDPKKRRFYLWRFGADASFDESHPLTGEHKKVAVKESDRRWTRHGREVRLSDDLYSTRGSYRNQTRPWDTRRTKADTGFPFNDDPLDLDEENKYVVVFHNQELDDHVESEKARYEAFTATVEKLRTKRNRLMDSISKAWVAQNEAAVYAKFLEDYLDPELWEGHIKTLPHDTFRYPHNHFNNSRFDLNMDPYAALVTYCVENNIDLDGLTVSEAAAAHFPPAEFFPKPRSYTLMHEDGTSEKKRDPLPSADGIPENILGLRFKSPPENDESEEGDEEWDD